VTSQSRCALSALVKLLDRLKQAGVYNNTVILILADHGINPGIFGSDVPGSRQALTHLQGAAHPLFLLKGRGDRGPLQQARGAVHLVDVAATLCAATGACTAPAGIPAGRGDENRPRRFIDYMWKNEYWQARNIPALTPYIVRGPVWRAESWSRAAE
jgi:arylsulfatase A-like enzyme